MNSNGPTTHALAQQVIDTARNKRLKLATAESCTGGLIGGALTDIPGSSDVYEGGFVTYSYESKRDLLGVSWQSLTESGAVSGDIAEQMAEGTLRQMEGRANIAVSVTGIAGPDGGTAEKPVGLVYFAIGRSLGQAPARIEHEKQVFTGPSRAEIRQQAVERALQLLLDAMKQVPHTGHERG